jgi:hypothetical protein
MDNFVLSANVVLPLFLIMMAGYAMKRLRWFDDAFLKQWNRISFRFFLSILLFMNIYQTSGNITEIFNAKLMLFAVAAVTICFLLLCWIIPKIESDNRRKGVLIQGIFRSNFVTFGLPITAALYGDMGLATTSIIIAIIVPFYNILSVIILEYYRAGKADFKVVLKGILTNPLIIGSFFGIAFLLTGIKLPYFFERALADVAKVATPQALVILGGSFRFASIQNYWKALLLGVSGRLLIVPLLFIPISIFLGFRNEELITLIAMFGAPTAISSYTMAQQMGADDELAGQMVVFAAIFSVFTMFLWVFLGKTWNLL